MLTFMDDEQFDENPSPEFPKYTNKSVDPFLPWKTDNYPPEDLSRSCSSLPSSLFHTPPNYPGEKYLERDPLLSSSEVSKDVPRSILQVETQLENPTPLYLKQRQMRQIKEYMSSQHQTSHQSPSYNLESSPLSGLTHLSPNRLSPKSMTPDTPLSPDDFHLNFEIDSILETLTTMDKNDEECMNIDIPINSAPAYNYPNTLPNQIPMMDYFPGNAVQNMPIAGPMSCPAHLPGRQSPSKYLDIKQFAKDRQKKDNHNAIERRRRFNINDRIKELGTLLPKQDPEMRPNKGTILKCSVDYIQSLQQQQLQWYKDKKCMLKKISVLEEVMRNHGIDSSEYSTTDYDTECTLFSTTTSRSGSTQVMSPLITIKKEPDMGDSFFEDS